jgi:hypothetical protein
VPTAGCPVSHTTKLRLERVTSQVALPNRSLVVPSVCRRLPDQVALASAPRTAGTAATAGHAGRSAAPAREASPVRERAADRVLGGAERSAFVHCDRPVGQERPAEPLARLGARTTSVFAVRVAPSTATIRRIIDRTCPGGLADLLGTGPAGSATLAVDSKSARGSRHGRCPARRARPRPLPRRGQRRALRAVREEEPGRSLRAAAHTAHGRT